MLVTATEFKNNMGKYLMLVSQEDVFITKNGKSIARLSSAEESKTELAKSLFGIAKDEITLEQARKERRRRYEDND